MKICFVKRFTLIMVFLLSTKHFTRNLQGIFSKIEFLCILYVHYVSYRYSHHSRGCHKTLNTQTSLFLVLNTNRKTFSDFFFLFFAPFFLSPLLASKNLPSPGSLTERKFQTTKFTTARRASPMKSRNQNRTLKTPRRLLQ